MIYVIGLLLAFIAFLLFMIGHDVTHKADEMMSLLRRTNELLLDFQRFDDILYIFALKTFGRHFA